MDRGFRSLQSSGNPQQDRGFATKPGLATALIDRAVEANVPAAWVAGDEVYGADPRLRAAVRDHGLGYVLAVSANRRVPTHAGPIRVDVLPALIPPRAWQRHSAGAGAHGPRLYSWAWFRLLAEGDADTGVHHLLIRRNDVTGEHAYLRCYSPRPVPLRALVAVAGQRWRIEESFKPLKVWSGSISTRSGAGDPGIDGPLWPCSLMPSWPWPLRSNVTPHPVPLA